MIGHIQRERERERRAQRIREKSKSNQVAGALSTTHTREAAQNYDHSALS